MARPDEMYHSEDEAKARIEGLSGGDLARLRSLAKVRALASPEYDWEDLMQDAFMKVICGERRWPRDLNASTFFNQVFRSLSSSRAKAATREGNIANVRSAVDAVNPDSKAEYDVIENHPDTTGTPEQVAHAEEVFEEIQSAFSDDEVAWDVLEWSVEGFPRADIQKELGLSDTTYDTITKRIRRKIVKIKKAMESES